MFCVGFTGPPRCGALHCNLGNTQTVVVIESALAAHDELENTVCLGQREETSILHSLTPNDSTDSTTTKHGMKILLASTYLKSKSETLLALQAAEVLKSK